MMHHQTKFGCKWFGVSEGITFKFLHTTLWLVINVLSNHVWQKKDQQFRRYRRNCHVLIIEALAFTLAHDVVPQYQVWLQNVWQFRRYHLDNHQQFDPSM